MKEAEIQIVGNLTSSSIISETNKKKRKNKKQKLSNEKLEQIKIENVTISFIINCSIIIFNFSNLYNF